MAAVGASNAVAPGADDSAKSKELTPEKIRLVAEQVYRMFLRDMRLARERTGRELMAGGVGRARFEGRR